MQVEESAVQYLKETLSEGEYLRVSVKGGGCNGLTTVYSTDTIIQPDDIITGQVLVDKRSMLFLKDASLVYEDRLGYSALTVKVNGAKGVCGCGESFSL